MTQRSAARACRPLPLDARPCVLRHVYVSRLSLVSVRRAGAPALRSVSAPATTLHRRAVPLFHPPPTPCPLRSSRAPPPLSPSFCTATLCLIHASPSLPARSFRVRAGWRRIRLRLGRSARAAHSPRRAFRPLCAAFAPTAARLRPLQRNRRRCGALRADAERRLLLFNFTRFYSPSASSKR
jgi:hypothetical protein